MAAFTILTAQNLDELTGKAGGDTYAVNGGILTIEAPIAYSNVMLLDDDNKATRIAVRKDEEGKNIRISRRTGGDL